MRKKSIPKSQLLCKFLVSLIGQITITARAKTATTTTTIIMNVWYLIIACVGIAGPTSAYEAFEDGRWFAHVVEGFPRHSLRVEVEKYCHSPTEYEESDGRQKYGSIGEWDVSAVTNMEWLFEFCSCNPPISNWNVGAVETFSGMFSGAATFNQDLSKWNVTNSEDFSRMFRGADAFNQDLSEWDVSNGQSFDSMFKDSGMNHFIGDWDLGSISNGVGRRDGFFSMLGLMSYNDEEQYEIEQLYNFVTLDKMGQRERKIDSVLTELINIAADRGMRGYKWKRLIRMTDDIKSLMENIKQLMDMNGYE